MVEEVRLPPKGMIRFFTGLNVLVYRLSGGRLMNRLEGAPICLVTMTGRKSGRKKTIALMYTPHGEDVLLVASLGGAPQHPVWYYNLKAHPRIRIQAGRLRRTMLAREATPEEKRTLWPVVVANYRSFEAYQQRTTRAIPLFICSPAP
ncbi:MAG TPA: nitroreductase family deazaflavin-dependent oxidoreductase [Steroidobacteraceae bacterium]